MPLYRIDQPVIYHDRGGVLEISASERTPKTIEWNGHRHPDPAKRRWPSRYWTPCDEEARQLLIETWEMDLPKCERPGLPPDVVRKAQILDAIERIKKAPLGLGAVKRPDSIMSQEALAGIARERRMREEEDVPPPVVVEGPIQVSASPAPAAESPFPVPAAEELGRTRVKVAKRSE